MKLRNFYYTEEYKNHWIKYGGLFDEKYFTKEKENKINNEWTIKHKKYFGNIHGKDIIGYERELFNFDKKIFYYKSDDAKIFKILKHKNENNYFIFNRDLSGFSILNLENNKEKINFYNNKFIENKGILVFVDLEHYFIENGRIIFYAFYFSEEKNNAFKRIFSYLIYDFSNPNKLDNENIILTDVRDIVLKNYNKELDFTYKAYFDGGDIIVEDFNNKYKFVIKEKDYIL